MPLQDLLDLLAKIPNGSGTLRISRDEFFGLYKGAAQEHGYAVLAYVKDTPMTGRALTLEQAIQIVTDKLIKKYPNV